MSGPWWQWVLQSGFSPSRAHKALCRAGRYGTLWTGQRYAHTGVCAHLVVRRVSWGVVSNYSFGHICFFCALVCLASGEQALQREDLVGATTQNMWNYCRRVRCFDVLFIGCAIGAWGRARGAWLCELF